MKNQYAAKMHCLIVCMWNQKGESKLIMCWKWRSNHWTMFHLILFSKIYAMWIFSTYFSAGTADTFLLKWTKEGRVAGGRNHLTEREQVEEGGDIGEGSERERRGKWTVRDRTVAWTETEMSDGETQKETDRRVVRESVRENEGMRGKKRLRGSG